MKFDEYLDELIDKQDGDWVISVEAEKFVDRLLKDEPQVLTAWLRSRASVLVSTEIHRRLHSRRSSYVRQARKQFREGAEAYERGERRSPFDLSYVIDEADTRRRLGDMVGADHRFVAGNYEQSGRHDLLLASFHIAVSKRIRAQRTAEVFTEEQYERLYHSIVHDEA